MSVIRITSTELSLAREAMLWAFWKSHELQFQEIYLRDSVSEGGGMGGDAELSTYRLDVKS